MFEYTRGNYILKLYFIIIEELYKTLGGEGSV